MKLMYIIISFLFYNNTINAQSFDKHYFGNWINFELQSILKSGKPVDSSYNILPRFLYIKNSKEIEINYRFEQPLRKYKITRATSNVIYTKFGELVLKNDIILLKDKYLRITKFIRYRK